MTGFTGPTSTGPTGPAGLGGGGATVTKGYVTITLSSNQYSAIDSSANFPTSIGTWVLTGVNLAQLVFNTSYDVSSIPPNINGTIGYLTTTANTYRVQMISEGIYAGSFPQTIMEWSPTSPNSYPNRWVMSIYCNGSSFSSASPSAGGLTINLNVFN
jgi:hypothetical protein